ncbi:SDR family NAD(P)-dependent oxidoreductase [Paenarthrobacter sp. NPDC091711]|uniref:SDR family NAD(P)-dependent oxidoreductase n=1 Tax=Paenarthrobacter sp. NPDC091711 TaxID=3364385 RepID=UPI003812DE8D
MTQDLRVALVTGAGSGMGKSTTEVFVDNGWHVIAVDVVAPQFNGRAASVTPLVADVRDRAALEDKLDAVLPNVGGAIHAVVNVAGVYPPSTLDTFTEELYRLVFDVNVLGVMNVMAAAKRSMPEGSAMVNFASVDGYQVSPGQLVYGASKAAVIMLTKASALELADRKIRVNAIAPGWVDTPGNRATGRMEAAAATIPVGRVAQPEEIAQWAWLLAGSDAAGFMTGETITLSGGDVIR